jgi:hypothetical protein
MEHVLVSLYLLHMLISSNPHSLFRVGADFHFVGLVNLFFNFDFKNGAFGHTLV